MKHFTEQQKAYIIKEVMSWLGPITENFVREAIEYLHPEMGWIHDRKEITWDKFSVSQYSFDLDFEWKEENEKRLRTFEVKILEFKRIEDDILYQAIVRKTFDHQQ